MAELEHEIFFLIYATAFILTWNHGFVSPLFNQFQLQSLD